MNRSIKHTNFLVSVLFPTNLKPLLSSFFFKRVVWSSIFTINITGSQMNCIPLKYYTQNGPHVTSTVRVWTFFFFYEENVIWPKPQSSVWKTNREPLKQRLLLRCFETSPRSAGARGRNRDLLEIFVLRWAATLTLNNQINVKSRT